MSDFLPVTKIPRSGLPAYAMVVGDPQRAASAAGQLHDCRRIGSNREYDTYRGTWRGTDLVVSSHGVGGPGAVCMFQELAMAGVSTIIRAGTAGGVVEEIQDGDLVIATAAVREDGVSDYMAPTPYPSFATPEVVLALQQATRASGHAWHRGVVWTKALFFPGVLTSPTETYKQAGVIAIEMELSALLVMAGLKRLRAGGILAIDGNPARRSSQAEYNPHRPVVEAAVKRMITITLEALHTLHAADLQEPHAAEGRPFVFQ
jgi:uridine phosphorylase